MPVYVPLPTYAPDGRAFDSEGQMHFTLAAEELTRRLAQTPTRRQRSQAWEDQRLRDIEAILSQPTRPENV
jgi:hypothetical protein